MAVREPIDDAVDELFTALKPEMRESEIIDVQDDIDAGEPYSAITSLLSLAGYLHYTDMLVENLHFLEDDDREEYAAKYRKKSV